MSDFEIPEQSLGTAEALPLAAFQFLDGLECLPWEP